MSIQSKKRKDAKKKVLRKNTPPISTGFSPKQREEYMDILQNIEFTLVTAFREDQSIDDATVRNALQASIKNKPCEDPRSQKIAGQLQGVRELLVDISDKIWIKPLQTILTSLDNHSSNTPGSKGYLEFASHFV